VDVACLQDPYTNKGRRVQGMSVDAVTILPEDPTPMVTMIIFNKNIETLVDSGKYMPVDPECGFKIGNSNIKNNQCVLSVFPSCRHSIDIILEALNGMNTMLLGILTRNLHSATALIQMETEKSTKI